MKDQTFKNWHQFKSEIAEEEIPLEEIKADLKEAGINVDSFLQDIKDTVRNSYRETSKSLSMAGITEKKALLERVFASIADLNRTQIFQKINQLADNGNYEALVFCREQNGEDISDEDLKCLLADFIVNGGDGDVDRQCTQTSS